MSNRVGVVRGELLPKIIRIARVGGSLATISRRKNRDAVETETSA